MATQDTTVKAFVGLPIEDLICSPIIGAAKGQRALAQETLSFVNDLAFLPKDNDDGSKNANIIDVSLDRLTNSSTTGEMAHVNQKIQMPMISLVNIPNFAMDTMEIDFVMSVGQTSSSTDTSSSSTRATDFSAKYEVHATAKQLPPTEGMAKFTQIMASVIEPINTSSEAGTV